MKAVVQAAQPFESRSVLARVLLAPRRLAVTRARRLKKSPSFRRTDAEDYFLYDVVTSKAKTRGYLGIIPRSLRLAYGDLLSVCIGFQHSSPGTEEGHEI